MDFTTLLWAVLPSLIVGVIMAWYNKQQKERDAKAADREADRLRCEKIQLNMVLVTAKLSNAAARAVQRGHTNGEIEECIEHYEKTMDEFKAYERELVARHSLD